MDQCLRLAPSVVAVVALLSGCSFVLDQSSKQCTQDSDCAHFDPQSTCQANACVQPPILLGQSAPQSGSNQALGIEMNRGLQLAFNVANQDGGVAGRSIKLNFLDDQYDPTLAEANARLLTDSDAGTDAPHCPTTQNPPVAGQPAFSQTDLFAGPKSVLALVGSVGTPTMARAAPIAVETGRLYFGAFTGATTMLRDTQAGPCDKYIFNFRASYAQEAMATLSYFFALNVPDDAHLISFDQNDAFGDSGYNGLVTAYETLRKVSSTNIQRFRYIRNNLASVPAQVTATENYLDQLLAADTKNHVVGIQMTDTYGIATTYIQGLIQWLYANDSGQATLQKANRLTLYFSNLSFVGGDALAAQLQSLGTIATLSGSTVPYSNHVFVSQVVPNYASDGSAIVAQYKQLIAAANATPTFTSLEGFLAGTLFVAGLRNNQGAFTPDNLVTAFETLPTLDLALGASAGFSPQNHQYSQSVWGTGLRPDGTFANVYFFSNNALQLFQ